MIRFFRNRLKPSEPTGSSTGRSSSTAPGSGSDLLDPRVMEQIGHLELLSRTVVDGLLAGRHRSTTKGGCCEFAQHRQYAPGDEIRQIDWQVYARNDRFFIRQFEEETNLHATLAIDASGSMNFGLSTVSKLQYARQAAACIARLLLRQRDAVGAMVLSQSSPVFLPSRQYAAHLKAVLATLQNISAEDDGDTGSLIKAAVPRMKRRGMFVLFSDCFGDLNRLAEALRVVKARGHDVIVMHTLAPEELSFDFRRYSSFQSLEVSGQRLNLDPAAIRNEYLQRMRAFLEELEHTVTGLGGDYVRLTAGSDLADSLSWFLRQRAAGGSVFATGPSGGPHTDTLNYRRGFERLTFISVSS